MASQYESRYRVVSNLLQVELEFNKAFYANYPILFRQFKPGIKSFSVPDENDPTAGHHNLINFDTNGIINGFLTIGKTSDLLFQDKYPGRVFNISVFVDENSRKNGIARKLTLSADEFIRMKLKEQNQAGKIFLLASLTIPSTLPERQAMEKLLSEAGYGYVFHDMFGKEISV